MTYCHVSAHVIRMWGDVKVSVTNGFGLMASLTCKWNFLKQFADRDDTINNTNIYRTHESIKGQMGTRYSLQGTRYSLRQLQRPLNIGQKRIISPYYVFEPAIKLSRINSGLLFLIGRRGK